MERAIMFSGFCEAPAHFLMPNFHIVTSWQFWACGQCLHSEINDQGPHTIGYSIQPLLNTNKEYAKVNKN